MNYFENNIEANLAMGDHTASALLDTDSALHKVTTSSNEDIH